MLRKFTAAMLSIFLCLHLLQSTNAKESTGEITPVPKDAQRLTHIDVKELQGVHEIPVGKVQMGKRYAYVLPVNNATGIDWSIAGVSSDCGCTAGVPVSKQIASGDQGSIYLFLKPKSAGKLRISVAVQLANKKAADLRFLLVGSAKHAVSAAVVRFEVDEHTESLSIPLTSNFEPFGENEQITVQSSLFEASSLKGTDSHKRTLHARLDRHGKHNSRRQTLGLLKISSGDNSTEIPLEIISRDVVEMRPSLLSFTAPTTGIGESVFSAKCFLRGDPKTLAELDKKVKVCGVTSLGFKVDGELHISKRVGRVVFATLNVNRTQLKTILSETDSHAVTWRIDGLREVQSTVMTN